MRANKIIELLLLIIMTTACSAKEEMYANKVIRLLQENKIKTEYFTHIVIIPEVGCGGCISEAEHFLQENQEEDILFIFTKVRSEKELRLRHGNILKRKNVIIDKEQEYSANEEEINIYPILIDIRNKDKYVWSFLEPGISYKDILIRMENTP